MCDYKKTVIIRKTVNWLNSFILQKMNVGPREAGTRKFLTDTRKSPVAQLQTLPSFKSPDSIWIS